MGRKVKAGAEEFEERRSRSTPRGVTLYCPTEQRPNYHRLTYRDRNGKRHSLSAGKFHDRAVARAEAIDAELGADLGEHGPRTVDQLVTAWNEYQRIENAASHYERGVEMGVKYIVPALGTLPSHQLTRQHIRDLCDTPTAPSVKRHLRAAVGTMLTWAHFEGGWGVAEREHYLPRAPRSAKREKKGREHGQSAQYINARFRPNKRAVGQVADAMRTVGYGELVDGVALTAEQVRRGLQLWLMVALAACTGLRQGELFALTAGQVQITKSGALTIFVDRQVVRLDGGGYKLTPPKWGRDRTTFVPTTTWWGAKLRDVLLAYIEEMGVPLGVWVAFDPKENSPVPDDLLFPGWEGGYWQPSNFTGDRGFMAARDASPLWSKSWTWHSLRHSFCSELVNGDPATGRKPAIVTDVALAAGHRDGGVTTAMYVGPTEGAMDRLNALVG